MAPQPGPVPDENEDEGVDCDHHNVPPPYHWVRTNGLIAAGSFRCRTSTSNLKRRGPKRAPGSLRENGTPINVHVQI